MWAQWLVVVLLEIRLVLHGGSLARSFGFGTSERPLLILELVRSLTWELPFKRSKVTRVSVDGDGYGSSLLVLDEHLPILFHLLEIRVVVVLAARLLQLFIIELHQRYRLSTRRGFWGFGV